ncbi:hypothetical protein ACGFIY_21185 [Micromonospora chersina]|uniref:hypothetical protein n=1 Tax=Micromonospora chersina TaxID=47854 RepID=UPI0037144071
MPSSQITARDMLAALYRHFGNRWAMLTEVTARTGARESDRRIDVLLVRPDRRATTPPAARPAPVSAAQTTALFPAPASPTTAAPQPTGPAIERMAIEIKVTRGDFLTDVRAPQKQAPWRALAHRHAYAVPAGLVRDTEVPADSGLIVIDFNYRNRGGTVVEFARRAPRCTHDPGPLPLANIMDAFWRTARLEAEAKGYGYEPHADDNPERLRAEVNRLRHELALAAESESRYREKCRDWQKRWAAHEPPPCGTCGKALHIARGRQAQIRGHEWIHPDAADAAMCEVLRTAAAERDSNSTGLRHHRTWVPGPEPAAPITDQREDVPA